MNCKFCEGKCQKAGKQRNGQQKYYCTACKKYQQAVYKYKGCSLQLIKLIPQLLCESVSLTGIARIVRMAKNTVVKQVLAYAQRIQKPPLPMQRNSFEMDELRTYVSKKQNQY